MAVGETGTDDGCEARTAFPPRRTPRTASQRAVELRARAAVTLEPVKLERILAEVRPDGALDLLLCLAGKQTAVADDVAHGGMTFRAFDASTIVGAIVVASIGSTVAAKNVVEASQPVESLRGRGRRRERS